MLNVCLPLTITNPVNDDNGAFSSELVTADIALSQRPSLLLCCTTHMCSCALMRLLHPTADATVGGGVTNMPRTRGISIQ